MSAPDDATGTGPVQKRRKAATYVVMATLIIVAVGAIAAFGFYQEEAVTYFQVQGWNLGPYEAATRDFVKQAAAGNPEGLEKYLSAPDKGFEVTREGGKISGVTVSLGRDPETRTLKELCPTADPDISRPEIVPLSGDVSVKAKFPKLLLDLRWRAGPRLTNLRWEVRL